MCKYIVHRLLVEFVFLSINYDGTIHIVLHPVRPTLHIQGYIPVCPSRNPVWQILLIHSITRVLNNLETFVTFVEPYLIILMSVRLKRIYPCLLTYYDHI